MESICGVSQPTRNNAVKDLEDIFKAKVKAERQVNILTEQLDMAKEQLKRNATTMKKTESDAEDREQLMHRMRQAMLNEASVRRQLMEANKRLERREERELIDRRRWADREAEMKDRHDRDVAALRQEMEAGVRMAEEAAREDRQLAMYGKEVEMEQMRREYEDVMEDLKARIVGLERERDRIKRALEQEQSKSNSVRHQFDKKQSPKQPLSRTQPTFTPTPTPCKPSIKQLNGFAPLTCDADPIGSPTPIPISRRVVNASSVSTGEDRAKSASTWPGKKKRVSFAPNLLQVMRSSSPSTAKCGPKSTSDVFMVGIKRRFVSQSSTKSGASATNHDFSGPPPAHPAFPNAAGTLDQCQSLMNQLRPGNKRKLYTPDKLPGEDF